MPRAARIVAICAAALAAAVAPLVVAAIVHPTPIDWRHVRFEHVRSKPAGHTEMVFLARYEKLRTVPPCDGRPHGGGLCDRYGYGGRVGASIEDAQALANATGEPVDVIVN